MSAQGNLGKDGDRVGEGVRVTGWFWFTYLFLDTFSFEMVFCVRGFELGEILRAQCQLQRPQFKPNNTHKPWLSNHRGDPNTPSTIPKVRVVLIWLHVLYRSISM